MAKGPATLIRRHIHRLAVRLSDAEATDRELLERFVAQRDEIAFEAVFRRHASMVLAVARRLLGNAHDAEDVCQAAFLVLAKKAARQRWQPSVASWLYRTAYLLAIKSRGSAMRRVHRESKAAAPEVDGAAASLEQISGQELLVVLDRELLALPESLRAPLVLCLLQGATRDEAAQRLGCPQSTLNNRLKRGREKLQAALLRRGLGLSALLVSVVLSQQAADAATLAMGGQTTAAALALAAGHPISGIVAPQVGSLIHAGLRSMAWFPMKAVLVLVLLGGCLSTVGVLGWRTTSGQGAPAAPQRDASLAEYRPPAITAPPAPAPQVALRYRFKAGDQFAYSVTHKAHARVRAVGQECVHVVVRTCAVTWTVQQVAADGSAAMLVSVDRVRVSVKGCAPPKGEDDGIQRRPLPPAYSGERLFSGYLQAQGTIRFTCTMDPSGQVREFKRAPSADGVSGPPPEPDGDGCSGEVLDQLLARFVERMVAPGAVMLPSEPVNPGTQWKQASQTAVPGGHALMHVDTEATFRGTAHCDGRPCALIALAPNTGGIAPSPTTSLGQFTVKGQKGRGRMVFDTEHGRLREFELDQNVHIESCGRHGTVAWSVHLSHAVRPIAVN